jgi:hypothetical protein
MNYTIVSPAYLPDINYFIPLVNCTLVLYCDQYQYVKRSSVNRSYPVNNFKKLTIPVKHDGIKPISQKIIAQVESWQQSHLKTIKHLYNSLPFFDDYFEDLKRTFNHTTPFLTDFLQIQLKFFLNVLRINPQVIPLSSFSNYQNIEEVIIRVNRKNGFCFQFFKEYEIRGWLDPTILLNNKIKIETLQKFNGNNNYNQSILNFIFQYGPESAYLIREIKQSCYLLR